MVDTNPLPLNVLQRQRDTGGDLTFEQVGLIYPVKDEVVYIRPALRKSVWLYCVLACQPVLTLIMLILGSLLHSTPIDRGFGLVSILSGIKTESAECLEGAALSGRLSKDVRLVIGPVSDGVKSALQYSVEPDVSSSRNGRLRRGASYY